MANLFAAEKFFVHQPTSLEMWTSLGPVEYVDLPNPPPPIPVVAFVACREGMGKIPADAWYTDGPSQGDKPTWTVVAILPNTDNLWMETGMNRSSQWAEHQLGW